MLYQHEARGTDRAITKAIDAHLEAERGTDDAGVGATDGDLDAAI
jgi:hypothetical protein